MLNKSPPDDRYSNFVREEIDKRPRGYPQLAAYVSADIDGRLYRRFGYLRNRLLLQKQDELVELEEKLDELDGADAAHDDDWYRLCSRRFDEEEPRLPPGDNTTDNTTTNAIHDTGQSDRGKLLKRISKVLAEYDELLLREHQVMSIREPTRKAHRGYFNWVWNEKPVAKEEYQFVFREDDFVILGDQEDRWLGFTEVFVTWMPHFVLKYLLTPKEHRNKDRESKTRFYDNEKTTRLVKMIMVTTTSLLLVLPIVVLYILTSHNASGGVKIGVTVVFVVAFALTLAAMTHASRHETFAACAAYCAVLVVFLGNVPGS